MLGATVAGVRDRCAGADAGPGRAEPHRSWTDQAGLTAIRGYRRWLSHRLPTQCRFTPTCGAYGLTAVDRYGLAVGGRMAARRLRRCRPGVRPGTFDPVL
jgi:hypothetical protein